MSALWEKKTQHSVARGRNVSDMFIVAPFYTSLISAIEVTHEEKGHQNTMLSLCKPASNMPCLVLGLSGTENQARQFLYFVETVSIFWVMWPSFACFYSCVADTYNFTNTEWGIMLVCKFHIFNMPVSLFNPF